MLPALMRKFHEARVRGDRQVVVWGTGSAQREFLHVDDLARRLPVLDELLRSAEHINVGTGEDLSIRQLAETMARVVAPTCESPSIAASRMACPASCSTFRGCTVWGGSIGSSSRTGLPAPTDGSSATTSRRFAVARPLRRVASSPPIHLDDRASACEPELDRSTSRRTFSKLRRLVCSRQSEDPPERSQSRVDRERVDQLLGQEQSIANGVEQSERGEQQRHPKQRLQTGHRDSVNDQAQTAGADGEAPRRQIAVGPWARKALRGEAETQRHRGRDGEVAGDEPGDAFGRRSEEPGKSRHRHQPIDCSPASRASAVNRAPALSTDSRMLNSIRPVKRRPRI